MTRFRGLESSPGALRPGPPQFQKPLARQRTKTNQCGWRAVDSAVRELCTVAPTRMPGLLTLQAVSDDAGTLVASRRKAVQQRWTQRRAEQTRSRRHQHEI